MRIPFQEALVSKVAGEKSGPVSAAVILRRIGLSTIVVLAAALRFIDLSKLGYVNHYYTAAVVSMLQSWHNFFFVAAEPGGMVSVDKPPLGLWIQTASAAIFGVNTFGLLLPEILAGLISVVVIYHLVQRSFGAVPGLLAALAMAITPVVVAIDRNNTMDSILILTLLLAAWAFIKAAETARLRFLLLGGALVGIGFNIKMLEAYLPLPAFVALYFLVAKERLWPKIGKLALTGLLLLVISFSWAVIVDLTPASQRPFVGSSGNNSEMSLIFGYNGLQRLFGMGRTSFSNATGFGSRSSFPNNGFSANSGQSPFRRSGSQPNGGFSGFPANRSGNRGFGGQAPRGGNFGGGSASGTGRPGLLRLVTAPLSKEVSWLLPIALFGIILLLFRNKLRWPLTSKHQAMIVWGVWLLTDAIFFSIAGFFHEYYLAQMAAPLVILAAIAIVELWHMAEHHLWLTVILLLGITGLTLELQIAAASSFVRSSWWQSIATGLFVAGGAWSILSAARQYKRHMAASFSILMAAVLISPGIWSALTAINPGSNQSLPAAYDGQSSGPANNGRLEINQALLSYLEANTQGITYLMAVPSSMQGSDYVIDTGRPVLYLGGFMGVDQVVDSTQLANMVATHQLRYIYWDLQGNSFGGNLTNGADLSAWITANCKVVSGFNTVTQNSGAPGGTTSNLSGNQFQNQGGFGRMQISLYDCSS